MKFVQKSPWETFGEKLGFVLSYFIFTTALFFVLQLRHKLPSSMPYLWAAGITLTIMLIGFGLKRWLR